MGRRIPWIKLAVVLALVWFVSTRVNVSDRLVVDRAAGREATDGGVASRPSAPSPAGVRIILSSGEELTLVAGDSLPAEVVPSPSGENEVRVTTPTGSGAVDARLLAPHGPLRVEPGLRSALRGVSIGGLLLALAVYWPLPLLLACRWHLLLRAAQVRVAGATTLRLTWIGLFFNTVVPGGTGGDLVKLYEAGRHTPSRSTVLSTIVVDRLAGLVALMVVGISAAAAFAGTSADVVWIGALGGAVTIVAFAGYVSPAVRRRVEPRRLLARLPFATQLLRLDDSLVAMGRRPSALAGAVALGLATHGLAIVVAFLAARSLGLTSLRLVEMFQIAPVAFVANAIPLSPGGLGQLEVAFQELMSRPGWSSPAQGFMVGVLMRAITVVWSLPGLVWWLIGGGSAAHKMAE